jgi:hypothetical protein
MEYNINIFCQKSSISRAQAKVFLSNISRHSNQLLEYICTSQFSQLFKQLWDKIILIIHILSFLCRLCFNFFHVKFVDSSSPHNDIMPSSNTGSNSPSNQNAKLSTVNLLCNSAFKTDNVDRQKHNRQTSFNRHPTHMQNAPEHR